MNFYKMHRYCSLPMINSINYYKALETGDLIELLTGVAGKYSMALSNGEPSRTLDSYRELMGMLQNEIKERGVVAGRQRGGSPESSQAIS
ncbi:MAG: hypothetical protein JST39_11955 [Bacteroidetes bacterium]|nr:hypothetical protein [Bacteroidota bacterium]